ncbi:hypothetical protein FEM48_Zijuj06G0157100 [Ziziphus jujuba var. spinosa]|uniref:Pentatricopeptide repeat-containing protein n=1 Tax=Ziziphus jujuba var. spinosa TaxID=714518 RepID=A0A978VA61_ZIZJJ|nr:hypothetical protein FEM48_Zijuj06G0157100 [Ziziphus jujuba var. spinosa]
MVSSLPSVAVNGTFKLDSDFRKQPSSFLSTDQVHTPYHSTYPSQILSSEAEMVHAHNIKTRSHGGIFVSTFLVNVYVKCGTMENAHKVFDKLSRRNVVAWTTLMTGYVHTLKPELAIQVFLEMLKARVYLTNYILGIALNACTSLHCVKKGEEIHAYTIKDLESSVKAFMKIREKNVISWTRTISAYDDNGEASRDLQFFTEMISKDVEPNEFNLTSILSLCCVMLTLGVGGIIHAQTIKIGFLSYVVVGTALINMYNTCGSIEKASKAFLEMSIRTLISWTSMITGFAQHGKTQQALQLFEDIRFAGVIVMLEWSMKCSVTLR